MEPDNTIDQIISELERAEKNKNTHYLIDILDEGCQKGKLDIKKASKQVAQGFEHAMNYFKTEKIYTPITTEFIARAIEGMGDSGAFAYKERKAEIEEVLDYFENKYFDSEGKHSQLLKTIPGELIKKGMETRTPDRIEFSEELKEKFGWPKEKTQDEKI